MADKGGSTESSARAAAGKQITLPRLRELNVEIMQQQMEADEAIRALEGKQKLVETLDYLDRARGKLLHDLMPGKGGRLFALHNNRDYSVQDEIAASDRISILSTFSGRRSLFFTRSSTAEIGAWVSASVGKNFMPPPPFG